MTTSQFTTIILKPSEGFVLTQADEKTPLAKMVFASQIALGSNDSLENWKEITVEEAERLKEEQKEANQPK